MHKGSDDMHFSERIHHFQDASLSFGRPGAGAPVRTKSGRLRSTVVGNPEIRSLSSLSSSLWSPLSWSLSPSPIIIIITIVHWCISNLWICLKSDFQTLGSKRTKECRNRSTTTSDMLSPPRRSRSITRSLVSAGEESCEMLLLDQGCEWNLIDFEWDYLKFLLIIWEGRIDFERKTETKFCRGAIIIYYNNYYYNIIILQRSKCDRDKRWQPSRPKVTSLSPSSWSVESSNFFSWLERTHPPPPSNPPRRKFSF